MHTDQTSKPATRDRFTRRETLRRAGAVALGAALLVALQACGGGGEDEDEEEEEDD